MRILVTPERLSELAGQLRQVSTSLMDVAGRCQSALASLDWEARQKAGVEGKVQLAVRQARALAERADSLARFLQDAARRFDEADRQELHVRGGTVLGATAPPPFWRFSELSLSGLPFVTVPRVVALTTGTVLGGLAAILPQATAVSADWAERVWNWLHGRGWKTNEELSPPSSKGKLYKPVDIAPLTAERDAVHSLRPADPGQYDQQVGCVQYAINRRPDLRVTDAPIPGAADYIPYYEKKGQALRLSGTEVDLRQKVKPGHAVVWPRQHEDLKGTAGWNYGHVAIVEEVYPDHIVVSQAGWPGKSRMEIRKEDMASLVVIL